MTTEEENTIRQIRLEMFSASADPDYLEIQDQLNTIFNNWLKILSNPFNQEPYISLIYDATFGYLKTALDYTLRQDAQRIYSLRTDFYIKAGVT